MLEQRTAVFIVNLIQDVNVLRPLMYMASRDFGFRVLILVSRKFGVRDLFGIWWAELDILQADLGARVETVATEWDAFRHLGDTGVIFAGSESTLREHAVSHSIFRCAPPTYLKVTLQHGFECVGFRQSSAHDMAHGLKVSFGADLLCAWQPVEYLTSLAGSQAPKVHVTGSTSVLQAFTGPLDGEDIGGGIVCENLHSVRMQAGGDLKSEFVGVFSEFCRLLEADSETVVLRPHPGGQYVLKHDVVVPPNARINNAPTYRVDLRRFAFGISAPSSVLVDMMLADIPTAVWRDREGGVDAGNYSGLTTVSSPREWLEFAREARFAPQPFIDLQRSFLARQQMPIEPRDVFARFAEIFEAAQRLPAPRIAKPVPRSRYLFVANAHLPTLQVCLERPLASLVNAGEISTQLLAEVDLRQQERVLGSAEATVEWVDECLNRADPDVVIFSRYSGPFGPRIVAWARRHRIPVIYQIDDDLLAVPATLGERKFAYHNAPERLAAVRTLMADADLVYASTERLRQRLLGYDRALSVVTGPINCSGLVRRRATPGKARRFGYMASADHLPNLMMVLPAIVDILDAHPELSFELFGSIPIPQELARFGERVSKVEPVAGYEEFLRQLAQREWDVGICPLTPTDFNLTKSNNKWVEYTASGIAVVASSGMIYDECCADGCGILAADLEGWAAGLESLIGDDSRRLSMVARAQDRLESEYGIAAHRAQILDVVEMARERAAERAGPANDS